MKDVLLDLEIRLLLLRYGRDAVQKAIARVDDFTPKTIDEDLRSAERRRTKPRTSSQSREDYFETEFATNPNVETLRVLRAKYHNRQFLPQLRDVKRFLTRIGGREESFKSRSDAARTVFRALAELPPERLLAVVNDSSSSDDSDFSILSNAIMGGSKRLRPQQLVTPQPRAVHFSEYDAAVRRANEVGENSEAFKLLRKSNSPISLQEQALRLAQDLQVALKHYHRSFSIDSFVDPEITHAFNPQIIQIRRKIRDVLNSNPFTSDTNLPMTVTRMKRLAEQIERAALQVPENIPPVIFA